MKQVLLLILSCIVISTACAQNKPREYKKGKNNYDDLLPLSYVTKNADTLYLSNTNTGRMVASLWDHPMSKNERKPVIIFLKPQLVIEKNQKMGTVTTKKTGPK